MDKIDSVSRHTNVNVQNERIRRNEPTNRTKTRKMSNKMYSNRFRNSLEDRIGNTAQEEKNDSAESPLEQHANRIVSKMEEDSMLMEDNMESEQLRKEALKHMPQCLTVKRSIKKKLIKSVIRQRKISRPIGLYKTIQYQTSIKYSQIITHMKNMAYTFELWYSPLKTIEGQFGSGTASYFKFLRWLFLMNVFMMIVTFLFIIIPQLTFKKVIYQWSDVEKMTVGDIFTGEGFFTNTLLYYGYYSNQTINVYGVSYNMPYAYFYTMLFLYVVSFSVLSYSVAKSYRKSFIETEWTLKNILAHKIFCGWDYSIATKEAAELNSRAIYNELKEVLNELHLYNCQLGLIKKAKITCLRIMTNLLIIITLFVIGYSLWFTLELHRLHDISPLVVAVVANLYNVIIPMIFTRIARYESYRNPKNIVVVTLIRSFLLSSVIVGTLVTFWLIHSSSQECWETSLGQEMYRLIIFDFLLSLLIYTVNALFSLTNRFKRILTVNMEFDVASKTLGLIYSQSLFWMGFYFSPLLSLVVCLKMFLTFHLKQYYLLKVCKPSSNLWRASQTHTWFLTLTFLAHLAIGGLMIFILLKVSPTSCGPFQGYEYFYKIVTEGLEAIHFLPLDYLRYLTKPGVVSLIIIALCARVYYIKERANARRDMVKMLRDMLGWASRDKEFLLKYISKVTKGEWQYDQSLHEDFYSSIPNMHTLHHPMVGALKSN